MVFHRGRQMTGSISPRRARELFQTSGGQLLRAARHSLPGVDWAAQIVEREKAFFVVEVAVDSSGPLTTTILLDLGGPEQKVLAQINGRG